MPFQACVFSILNGLILTPKTHFAQFTSWILFIFSPGAKHVCDTGDEVVIKIDKKQVCRCTFCYNFQSIVNMKQKCLGCEEKNMDFYLTPQKYYFQLSPGGMRM